MSKRQKCLAGSSTHAEIVSASTIANEAVWFRGFLDENGLPQHAPTPLHMDNSAVYALSRDFSSCVRTRHIERRHFGVRELQHRKEIETVKVASEDNWSDLFTKVHTRVPFEGMIRKIMNLVRVGVTIIKVRSSLRASSLGK